MAEIALDVSAYERGVLQLRVYEFIGGGSATVRLETSMTNESEDGWEVVATWTAVTSTTVEKILATDMLRYLRWNVSALSGSSPSITFDISGMLERAR